MPNLHNKMKYLIAILIILKIQSAISTSTHCESKNVFDGTEQEIKSTNDYLELNQKSIEYIDSYNHTPERTIKNNGYIYFSNIDGLFVQKESATTASKIDGFDEYTNIFLDTKSNLIYLGTHDGLFVLRCDGGRKANKISVTNGISADFGVIDNNGDVYFGSNGDNTNLSEELYVLRKEDQSLTKIKGIEKSLGSYAIESILNPNKIVVDTKNNVYVGAFTSYIYLIKFGETTATKLNNIKNSGGVTSVVVDSEDTVYFRTNDALYSLKNNDSELIKIIESVDDFNYFLSVDANDNLYFQIVQKMYVLKSKEVSPTEINVVSTSKGNINLNFTNLRNIKVKNNILYLTTNFDGKELVCTIQTNETTLTEIHRIDNEIMSIAIDNSNNIYYITYSTASKKYVPFILRRNSNIPIEIHGITGHLSHVFSDNKNNIYFGSGNGLHMLKDEEVTPYKLRTTESQISSFVVDENDNEYFGTDYDGAFMLRSGEMEATKIEGINKKYGSYVETFGDKKYDVIYFQTGGALYKLNGGDTLVSVVVEGTSPALYLSDCMNNTFYVKENDGIFSVKYNDANTTHIADIQGEVSFLNSDSANNLYFVTNNQLQVIKPGEQRIIINNNQSITSLNRDRDDNVYFSSGDNLFILKRGEMQPTKIKKINNKLNYFVTNGNDVFIVTDKNNDGKGLFLIRNKLQFETIFENRNLGEIENNQDETILNTLNYLNVKGNYMLSKNKNKIIDKTPTSATIVAIKGKFEGRFDVTYNINSKVDENVKNFDLNDLLKKAIFFDHMNKNAYNFETPKEIQDIHVSIDNLKFSLIQVTRNSELSSSVEFKNVCFNKKKVANTSPLSQTVKIPECIYDTKEIILFHITTGLNKTNETIDEPVAFLLNSDDEMALSNFLNVNDNKDVPTKTTLSKSFDLSNLKKYSHEMNLQKFTEDEQEIIIPPKQRILVNYSVRIFVLETNLNLKQKIKGTLIAKIIGTYNEQTVQITIKEAMQILKKYSLFPNELSINDDNSVTFNGRARLAMKRESEPKIIRNFFNV